MELVIAAIVCIGLIVSWLFLPASTVDATIEREEVTPLTTIQPHA